MDLSYSDEEKAFRAEVRAFLEEKLPKEMSDKIRKGEELGKDGQEQWHAILNAQGWLAPNWPKKFGGAEWNAVQRHIFEEEAAAAKVDPRCLGGYQGQGQQQIEKAPAETGGGVRLRRLGTTECECV